MNLGKPYMRYTMFNNLMVVAYKEFSLTNQQILQERRNKYSVIAQQIDIFNKKLILRNLPNSSLDKQQLVSISDLFYQTLYYRKTYGDANLTCQEFIFFFKELFGLSANGGAMFYKLLYYRVFKKCGLKEIIKGMEMIRDDFMMVFLIFFIKAKIMNLLSILKR